MANLNTFKVEMLESLKKNVEVLAQNLKFSTDMIENLIRDEFRSNGVQVDLDRMVQAQTRTVEPQIDAPKAPEAAQITAPVVAAEQTQAEAIPADAQPAQEEKKDETQS